MMKNTDLLQKILNAEAKEAEWGAKASVLKREYCELFSPLHKGDKVLFNPYGIHPVVNGIISMVKYNNGAFRYQVRECTQAWEIRRRRYPIWINPKEHQSIQKAEI